ncbi:MAG: SPOR domain-containing protein [Pseudomonadota bacterium]|uniref:SPOR domain-containing protein n=1 Tax=Alcanivorax sp. TaxID=1872427 RepID=UPI0025C1E3CA|nr:SPOR domain-containing protein [Alcanivorax sp.]MED5239271.1 SPOR domain-containing protein [Pseudomonadota bacterium]MEE3321922.1 SPOR domain-containing protein [Pseudomonadota bacterium]
MNKQTRQRLIGAALLLILAAVLSPLVFRTPAQIRTALNMEIPPAPDYQAVSVEPVVSEEVEQAAAERIESDHEQVRASASQPGTALADDDKSRQSEPVLETLSTPPAPALSAEDDPVLAGFIVQVGSFSNPDSAVNLVKRLKDAGFRAYTETESRDGKLLHRVMVGPEIRKEDAEQTRERLANDSRFKLDGLVRIYAP